MSPLLPKVQAVQVAGAFYPRLQMWGQPILPLPVHLPLLLLLFFLPLISCLFFLLSLPSPSPCPPHTPRPTDLLWVPAPGLRDCPPPQHPPVLEHPVLGFHTPCNFCVLLILKILIRKYVLSFLYKLVSLTKVTDTQKSKIKSHQAVLQERQQDLLTTLSHPPASTTFNPRLFLLVFTSLHLSDILTLLLFS